MAKVTSKTSPVVEAKRMSWAELVAVLTRHKVGPKDGTGFMPAAIEPGPREGARVVHVSALALDVEAKAETQPDGTKRTTGPMPPTLQALAAELELWGVAAALATSYSHEAPAADRATLGPRYRLVLRPSRAIEPSEVKALGLHVAALLGLSDCIDTGCLEPARLYYLPRCPADRLRLAESAEVKGQPLDVDEMLRAAQASKAGPPQGGKASGSVIAAFNAAHDAGAILERHGYVSAGRNRWRWPQSTTGLAGVVLFPESGRVFSHHGADPLHGEHGHDAFSAWCVLAHGGDLRAAVRDAAHVLGMDSMPAAVQPQQAPPVAHDWPTLDPLPELQDEAPAAFPFEGLGPILGAAARAVADAVQAPDSLAAGSVLAAAAVAAQPFADVFMPHGQAAPLSLFVVTSASSGDRKSATDAIANAPIQEQRHREARQYAMERAAYEAERKDAAKKRADDSEAPVVRSIVVSNGTTQGLHSQLQKQPHIGLFSPEGAELIGGHSMREERKSAGIAWLLKAWGGETLDDLTRGAGLSVLIGRRVSLHVLLQPVIARGLLADPLAQGQGWIARCLMAAPLSIAGTRLFREGAQPGNERPEVRRFHARLAELLQTAPPLRADGDGCELQPRRLPMSDEARALWIEFYDECERQQAPGASLAGVKPWASKAAEHAARVAGVVTVAEDRHAAAIGGETMAGAIAVAIFYLGEHVRLMGQSVARLRDERLRGVLAFLKERGPRVRHADVLQRVPRPLRSLKAEGLAALLDELERRGYVRRCGDLWELRP